MLTVFVSQPMRGKTKEQILKERDRALREVRAKYGEDVEALETYFDDFEPGAHPLMYLARSIEYLTKADVVYFVKGWNEARGCIVEHECAKQYGLDYIEGI